MALRTYQHNTLNDNWFEERAPKLNGVLADYGHRVFSTVHTAHFQDPKDTNLSKPAQMKRLVRHPFARSDILSPTGTRTLRSG